MPNHVANRIELIGTLSDVDACIKTFGTYHPASVNKTADDTLIICKAKSESAKYSFCWLDPKTGKVTNHSGLDQIGLPDGMEIEINDAMLAFPDFKKVIPPPDDPAYRDEPSQEIAQKSPNWWYNWNVKHWGSKWGSYSHTRIAINIFDFETAWSNADPVIAEISKAFPQIKIKYCWADEDSGQNCGRQVYKNGLQDEDIPLGGSKRAFDIYFELHPGTEDEYELVDGKYKYKNEEE